MIQRLGDSDSMPLPLLWLRVVAAARLSDWSPDEAWLERDRQSKEQGRAGDEAGITALMRACACKYCVDVYDPALLGARELKMDQGESHDGTMIKPLLQLGADANMGIWRRGEFDYFYETALNLCLLDIDLMKCLLAHGADVVNESEAIQN